MRVADRRSRSTFWIDDGVIDRFGPWLGQFPQGSAAIAIYAALARHADRAAEAWPSMARLASSAAVSQDTARRALRLLEVAGLIEICEAFDEWSGRQTSSRYVLLEVPEHPPSIELDPKTWPAIARRRVMVTGSHRERTVVREGSTNGRGEGRTVGRGGVAQSGGLARATECTEGNTVKDPGDATASRAGDRRIAAVEAWTRDRAAELGVTPAMVEATELERNWRSWVALGTPRHWRREWDAYLSESEGE